MIVRCWDGFSKQETLRSISKSENINRDQSSPSAIKSTCQHLTAADKTVVSINGMPLVVVLFRHLIVQAFMPSSYIHSNEHNSRCMLHARVHKFKQLLITFSTNIRRDLRSTMMCAPPFSSLSVICGFAISIIIIIIVSSNI